MNNFFDKNVITTQELDKHNMNVIAQELDKHTSTIELCQGCPSRKSTTTNLSQSLNTTHMLTKLKLAHGP
jgi:hypothetical protein